MSSTAFDALPFPLAALVVALLLGIGVTMLFRAVVPRTMTRVFRASNAEKRYVEMMREGYMVRDRLRVLQNEAEKLASQRARLDGEMRALSRRLAVAESRPPDFIHEVGDPRAGPNKYIARLTVDSTSPFLKPSSDLYNPIWRHLNLAEIWATSREHARQLLDLAYPDKLGYQKMFIDGQTPPTGGAAR